MPDFRVLDSRVVLVTGGTGAFGRGFAEAALARSRARKVIIFSRDELKQSEMARALARWESEDRIRFFLGDVRDRDRLQRAFSGVDFVLHAAALHGVPTLEYNPFEAVKTNIVGAQNVVNAALDHRVRRVVCLSTGHAVNPTSLYGATQLCAEKIVVAANAYAGALRTRLAVARYGRDDAGVSYPRGPAAAALALTALQTMRGGEIFVTKAAAPRQGSAARGTLLTEEEAARARDLGGCYAVRPAFRSWARRGRDPASRVS